MNSMTYEYYYNGGGVSSGDINKDGLPDLFFTGNVTKNRLYLNQGEFRFLDITERSGVKDSPSWTTGSTMVDINGDGILDIYVCRSGKLPEDQRANLFFVSEGLGEDGIPAYREMASQLGLADTGYSTQALFFDYDRDNDLDMFLLNHNVYVRPFYEIDKIRQRIDKNVGDKLFRNDNGVFIDVSGESGIISNELGYGLGVCASDLNNDGWADLYVTNDYSEHDFLYINNQDGSFTEVSKTSFKHQSNFSMGTDIADVNNDGLPDIGVLDMVAEDNYGMKTSMNSMSPELFYNQVKNGFHYQYMHNTLQLNRGNLRFSEIAQFAGISNTDWSWAPLFLDIDLDGLQDLFITNGLKRDFRNNDFRNFKARKLEDVESGSKQQARKAIEDLIERTPEKKLINYVFRNSNGLIFEDKKEVWGIGIKSLSNGLTYCDLDNDGDLDLVTNNVDEQPFVYENKAADYNLGSYLKICLEGPTGNKNGLGSKVTAYSKNKSQIRELFTTRGYQSSVEPIIHFGLGDSLPDSVVIHWPDGYKEVIYPDHMNKTIILQYGNSAAPSLLSRESIIHTQFGENIAGSVGLAFHHFENEFDDFKREVLLPHRMSRLGPALAVGDINKDGLDDIYAGGSIDQSGQLYLQSSSGEFIELTQPSFVEDKQFEDVDALFFDADNDGDLDLYVVSGGNEYPRGHDQLKDRLYLNSSMSFIRDWGFTASGESGSKVISIDFDKDNDLDLVVAGRQFPGKYPLPVSTRLLENHQGDFTDRTTELAPDLEGIGMVTDIVSVDYDNDLDEDLVLVGEWLSPVFLDNTNGRFSINDNLIGLQNMEGWWNSIVVADFDKDGDPDFVTGNNGLNYKYRATEKEPFRIYSDDFDENGSLDIVLGYYNGGNLYPLRGRECSSQQIPDIRDQFRTYHDFGLAKLQDIYGSENLESSLRYKVSNFASTYIENLGNQSFRVKKLPSMAQFSSINSILVKDVNSDTNLDLVVGGNNFHAEVETTRNDSSYGLLLLGDGKGNFQSVDSHVSGLYLDGDLRDIEHVSMAGGKTGLVGAMNGSALVFHLINDRN